MGATVREPPGRGIGAMGAVVIERCNGETMACVAPSEGGDTQHTWNHESLHDRPPVTARSESMKTPLPTPFLLPPFFSTAFTRPSPPFPPYRATGEVAACVGQPRAVRAGSRPPYGEAQHRGQVECR